MPNLPFTTVDGKKFPIPRTIISAAISQLRHSDATDFEIACFICECLAFTIQKNDFNITSVVNPAPNDSTEYWTLAFKKY